jgi:hypothetical protein
MIGEQVKVLSRSKLARTGKEPSCTGSTAKIFLKIFLDYYFIKMTAW